MRTSWLNICIDILKRVASDKDPALQPFSATRLHHQIDSHALGYLPFLIMMHMLSTSTTTKDVSSPNYCAANELHISRTVLMDESVGRGETNFLPMIRDNSKLEL